MNRPRRGHRSLPHTADLRIEAWAPTQWECLAEAVSALVAGFVDVSGAQPRRTVRVDLAADSAEEALLAVLDEVIYLTDTEDVVPLDVEVEAGPRGPRVRMPVVPVAELAQTGAVPKAVTLHGLRIGTDGRRWSCTATIDV